MTKLYPSHNSNNFHFLRFLAASSVMIGHGYNLNGLPDLIEQKSFGLYPTGLIAVYIFFIISGYCIVQSRVNSDSTTSYLIKRILRIFPGLAAALFFSVFIIGAFTTEYSLSQYLTTRETYSFFKHLKLYPFAPATLPGVFTHNPHVEVNGSLWTLAYEFTMYLFVIVAVALFRSRWNLFTTLFALFLVVYGFNTDFFSAHIILPVLHLSLNPLVNFGIYFVLGMLFYIYRDFIPLNARGAVLALVFWLGMYPLSSTLGYLPLIAINCARFFSLTYLVMYLSSIKGPLNSFGKNGDYSYGIYIYSFPIQQVVFQYLGSSLEVYQQILLSFLLVLPLAWFSWHYIEKPALRYKPGTKKQPASAETPIQPSV